MRGHGHVVLLGDSIFDNKSYVNGGPDVVAQLRDELPHGWEASLLAIDGDVTSGVVSQLRSLPRDTTHLVVSVGGNDALGFGYVLQEPAGSVADALSILSDAQDAFSANYAAMIDAVAAVGLPTAVCTIYDTPPSEPNQRIIKSAIALFNDHITRQAFLHGVSLIDLRLICNEDADYANPIEPSVQGGRKIAQAIAALLFPDGALRSGVVVGGRQGGGKHAAG
jgi:GDSL-like Lipase/Acylhydrolase family